MVVRQWWRCSFAIAKLSYFPSYQWWFGEGGHGGGGAVEVVVCGVTFHIIECCPAAVICGMAVIWEWTWLLGFIVFAWQE